MTSYSLKQISASAYHVLSSREKVGFVNACPVGFVARIGNHCETAATPQVAFRLVAARALGYESPAALVAHNQIVRQQNAPVRAAHRAMRAHARYVVDQLLGGNYEPLHAVFKALNEEGPHS